MVESHNYRCRSRPVPNPRTVAVRGHEAAGLAGGNGIPIHSSKHEIGYSCSYRRGNVIMVAVRCGERRTSEGGEVMLKIDMRVECDSCGAVISQQDDVKITNVERTWSNWRATWRREATKLMTIPRYRKTPLTYCLACADGGSPKILNDPASAA